MNPLVIPGAFNFAPPVKCSTSYGKWVVRFYRERMTHTVNDHAYFWRKKEAVEFYKVNTP